MLTSILLFLGGMGVPELIVIFLIIVLLFGAKKIPDLARGLGKGIREFKDASREIKSEIEKGSKEDKV
ncbi:MAG: twin-arginine translocase TatA/TatE family subunit [Cytophagaceae bacterium]